MQVLELAVREHPYFVGAQFHPELPSRPLRPHRMFMGLVAAAIRHAYPEAAETESIKHWLAQPRLHQGEKAA